MFKTSTLKENELAPFINNQCWADIKYIIPKSTGEYLVIYWDEDEYEFC